MRGHAAQAAIELWQLAPLRSQDEPGPAGAVAGAMAMVAWRGRTVATHTKRCWALRHCQFMDPMDPSADSERLRACLDIRTLRSPSSPRWLG